MEENKAVRLQVWLARCGIGSRRRCEVYISEGRVRVNGSIVKRPGTKVLETDDIRFDGRPAHQETKRIYLALNKPPGFLCSDLDPAGRPLAKDLITPSISERIFHVGRLDYMSSGLIFFTNDGDFARRITNPRLELEKEYIVNTRKEIPPELMENFLKGITIEGETYRAKKIKHHGSRTVQIILLEGKNRELRKVFQSASLSIKRVHRIRIGHIHLTGLDSGRFRRLKDSEVKSLFKRTNPKGIQHGHSH